MAKWGGAEMAGQGLANVGKGAGDTERARLETRTEEQHGNVFTRVVGAAPGRVATMVSGDHGQIA